MNLAGTVSKFAARSINWMALKAKNLRRQDPVGFRNSLISHVFS